MELEGSLPCLQEPATGPCPEPFVSSLYPQTLFIKIHFNDVMRSLHNVHGMNAYRAGHVCLFVRPSVRMVQLENSWTDLDEIWYGDYAIGDYPKIVLLNFLKSVISTWRKNKLVRWDRH
jgi:hypothetical protein